MARQLGEALEASLKESLKERGVSDLDPEDREFLQTIARVSSPEEAVNTFIEESWDFPAYIRVINLGYNQGLITQDQYIRLAGVGQLKSREFDT